MRPKQSTTVRRRSGEPATSGEGPRPDKPDRRVQILDATVRVIVDAGIANTSVEAVALEAGVSRTLVHYYFKTREDLHEAAFGHLNQRFESYLIGSVPPGHGRTQVERLLLAELDDSQVITDGWVIWSEITAAAFFNNQLRKSSNAAADAWVGILASLIGAGVEDGSVRADVKVKDAAERLAGLVDSVGNRWALGAIPTRRARVLIRDGIRIELAPDV